EQSGVDVVGWVARRRFSWLFEPQGPSCPTFEEPFPEGWTVPLDVDAVLPPDEIADENLRYLLDREEHFAHEHDLTLARAEYVARANEILDETEPHVVVWSDVPHSALGYAIYVSARERGIVTMCLRYGPAPYLLTFTDEIGRPLFPLVSDGV